MAFFDQWVEVDHLLVVVQEGEDDRGGDGKGERGGGGKSGAK